MKNSLRSIVLLFLAVVASNAQEFDNKAKRYVLESQTEARTETSRTHRMVLCDYQPSGLYVRRGERFKVTVSGLDADYKLSTMIGFKPMWSNRNQTQENELREGANTVTASQEGILSFIFVKREGFDTDPVTVDISVTGGQPFPLYVYDETEADAWESDVEEMSDAKFVQLLSDKVLITIPYEDYVEDPIDDVEESFTTIHRMIELDDELAGFDDSAPENMRTRNRINYLTDFYTVPPESDKYYAYASSYFIGMKRDNFTHLTEKLGTEWGYWHETGHTYQQQSWRWSAITEVQVNLFSLYVQEDFGLPSKLNDKEGRNQVSSFEMARRYIANPNKNYLVLNRSDYTEFFTKLVMFHQLKSAYGWNAFTRLQQEFRRKPHRYDPNVTDTDLAARFVYAMCVVTRNNLVPFFKKWGINIDAATAQRINALRLPLPKTDPSTIFK